VRGTPTSLGEGAEKQARLLPHLKMKSFSIKIDFKQKVKAADEEEAISLAIEEMISLFEAGHAEEFVSVELEEQD